MFKTILVPTDGSELSDKAIAAAANFAKSTGARLIGLSVADPLPPAPMAEASIVIDTEYYAQKMREVAQANVAKVAEAARQAGVPCETVVRSSSSAYEEIIRTAKDFGCDVIFMASHGRRGLSALFIGSETQKVLTHSTIPVLVFR